MIERILEAQIRAKLFKGKTLVITGPRQVGKSTLIKKITGDQGLEVLNLDGDDLNIRTMMTNPGREQLSQILGNYKIIFIDEAQRIINIGLTSKIIHDQFSGYQLILSGSSAFELAQETHEPLTGRKWSFNLWPVSWQEWENHMGYVNAEVGLETRLIFGFYPEVLNNPGEEAGILKELADSYLFKDILNYAGLRKSKVIMDLVKALALQVGQEVKYAEVSQLIGIDGKTVSRYIDVLEQAYVIFRIPAFSRNERNEIKFSQKIYFHDNGIRNAVIGNLNLLSTRNDKGMLWENFLMSERHKRLSYERSLKKMYFWRTRQQQEIDLVEEGDGKITAYEFKWSADRQVRFPLTFTKNYGEENQVIHRQNFRDFITMPE